MKKIEAIIQPDRLDAVKEELFKADVHKMTVSRVKGCGQQRGYTETYRGKIFKVNLLPKIKLEIAVNADFVQITVDAIIKGARTGKIGDGKIFITDLPECIRIRTGEKGQKAIG
ncbi:MAG: P-II family nitrogen regulator [Candidatus Omnitrophica bacterium]|nr:P-II family nitrogen regulator [Candidatus Omnitrophota bacterium]